MATPRCVVPKNSPGPWYISNISQTPEVPYCYYKLVTNVIRALKINVLSYPWYTTPVSQSAFRARPTQLIITDIKLLLKAVECVHVPITTLSILSE